MGRIVTMSDGAGGSVTVSNWGVAQTSRHPSRPSQHFPSLQSLFLASHPSHFPSQHFLKSVNNEKAVTQNILFFCSTYFYLMETRFFNIILLNNTVYIYVLATFKSVRKFFFKRRYALFPTIYFSVLISSFGESCAASVSAKNELLYRDKKIHIIFAVL
jgi:hypothetical protein